METFTSGPSWPVLTCQQDAPQSCYSTLIPLPHPYVATGGRFREIYYWDTYFTSEGLAHSGQLDLVIALAKNFAYLIDVMGHIPNGNRICYRSRPAPFFSCLIDIIARYQGVKAIESFVNPLEKEYQFWMAGEENVSSQNRSYRRVVWLDDNTLLNRYWDDLETPRPESYLYRHIRATCESGWDFSSRWLRNKNQLSSLYTTELIPVDLNALLYLYGN